MGPALVAKRHTICWHLAGCESEQHKLKRCLAQVCSQKERNPGSERASELLICQCRIEAVCQDELPGTAEYEDLQRALQALRHSDDQCEHTAKHVFYCQTLQTRLKARGWEKDALALEIIGEAHQAWSVAG